jgi:hypothetical protein
MLESFIIMVKDEGSNFVTKVITASNTIPEKVKFR